VEFSIIKTCQSGVYLEMRKKALSRYTVAVEVE
jgi:hypothetical protein